MRAQRRPTREACQRNAAARAGLLGSILFASWCRARICSTSSMILFGFSKAWTSTQASSAKALNAPASPPNALVRDDGSRVVDIRELLDCKVEFRASYRVYPIKG